MGKWLLAVEGAFSMTGQPLGYSLSTTDKSTRVQHIYTEQVTKQHNSKMT